MIQKRNLGTLTNICVAISYAILTTVMTCLVFRVRHPGWGLLIFAVSLCVFYWLGKWMTIERPAEIEEKLPISSKEHRRRRRAFHEWLASRERR